jgi:hypothetical protein
MGERETVHHARGGLLALLPVESITYGRSTWVLVPAAGARESLSGALLAGKASGGRTGRRALRDKHITGE